MIVAILTTFASIAQSCPTPIGNSIIIKPTYTVGSSIANETNVKLCYNNTSATKVTAVQFKVNYDTVAFKTPTVTLLTADAQDHYVQSYVSNGTITITSVYNGAIENYTYPSGELFNINFKHAEASVFQYLSGIQPITFNVSYPSMSSTSLGADTTLTQFNAGGIFTRPAIHFAGIIHNVSGSLTKNVSVNFYKRPKGLQTPWTLVKTSVTTLTGAFDFKEIVDTTYWVCKVEVDGSSLGIGNIVTTADAQKINRFVLGLDEPASWDFYTSDVNNSGAISVSDVYGVFTRIASRGNTFQVPDVRFFTEQEKNIIEANPKVNKTFQIPGTNIFTHTLANDSAIHIYVAVTGDANGTGLNMAYMTPIRIINPANAPNFIIDQTTDYYAGLKEIELNLPTLNVEEGNLVNIPVKVLTDGQELGALQLSLKYDKDLLEFKGVTAKAATEKWLSFTNPNDTEVEWGGLDMNETSKVKDGQEVVVMQFIAKKPKDQWNGSPLYVTRKFVGNNTAADLKIRPTDGRIEIFKAQQIAEPLEGELSILVYPNPTSGIVAVQFKVPSNNNTSVYFVDMNGNKVANILNGKVPVGEYRYTANLSQLPPTAYFAVVECDGNIIGTTKVLNGFIL